MKNTIKKKRFYFRYRQKFRETEGLDAPSQHLDSLRLGNEIWGKVKPVGLEFGPIENEKRVAGSTV